MIMRTMTPDRVIAIRQKLGMNVSAFARELNCTRQTIHEWERGSKAPSGTSVRLLEILEEQHDNGSSHRESTG